jgi:uncharacterized protein involved in outer membrane biogenesis
MNPEKKKKATQWFLGILIVVVLLAICLSLVIPIARAVHDARQQHKSGR